MIILSHAEDMEISPYDYRLAENIATVQHIHLAEYLGAGCICAMFLRKKQ